MKNEGRCKTFKPSWVPDHQSAGRRGPGPGLGQDETALHSEVSRPLNPSQLCLRGQLDTANYTKKFTATQSYTSNVNKTQKFFCSSLPKSKQFLLDIIDM